MHSFRSPTITRHFEVDYLFSGGFVPSYRLIRTQLRIQGIRPIPYPISLITQIVCLISRFSFFSIPFPCRFSQDNDALLFFPHYLTCPDNPKWSLASKPISSLSLGTDNHSSGEGMKKCFQGLKSQINY